jgi:L-asparaginase II
VVASVGDEAWPTVYRSAAKPFQAVPLVEDGVVEEFGLSSEDLALSAASHNGEARHLEGVLEILRKVGAEEHWLRLGPLPPLLPETAEALYRSGAQVRPIHNNCSGQHAALLGLALVHDWPLGSYLDPGHPLQRRMLEEMGRFTGMATKEIATMPDGCGMLAFGVPLSKMALSFARFGAGAQERSGPARVLGAMADFPFMVGGTGRLCTALTEATGRRMVGKLGAEGVYCVAVPEEGLGIGLKVEDGGGRAGDAAVIRVLDLLGLLDQREGEALDRFRRKEIRNTLGEVVGEVRANFTFKTRGSA